jgi:hypothetical protein
LYHRIPEGMRGIVLSWPHNPRSRRAPMTASCEHPAAPCSNTMSPCTVATKPGCPSGCAGQCRACLSLRLRWQSPHGSRRCNASIQRATDEARISLFVSLDTFRYSVVQRVTFSGQSPDDTTTSSAVALRVPPSPCLPVSSSPFLPVSSSPFLPVPSSPFLPVPASPDRRARVLHAFTFRYSVVQRVTFTGRPHPLADRDLAPAVLSGHTLTQLHLSVIE